MKGPSLLPVTFITVVVVENKNKKIVPTDMTHIIAVIYTYIL